MPTRTVLAMKELHDFHNVIGNIINNVLMDLILPDIHFEDVIKRYDY